MIYFQIERRGRSEEKRSSWQPYRVALSDEASGDTGDTHGEAEDDDDEAVYGKPIKYTYANTNKNSKDNKWSNRRAGNSFFSRHRRIDNIKRIMTAADDFYLSMLVLRKWSHLLNVKM